MQFVNGVLLFNFSCINWLMSFASSKAQAFQQIITGCSKRSHVSMHKCIRTMGSVSILFYVLLVFNYKAANKRVTEFIFNHYNGLTTLSSLLPVMSYR